MRGACMEMVHELARRDPRVVYVGSDLGAGTLDAMKEEIPERFFMEGVAEANLIGMAAGLAMEGSFPMCIPSLPSSRGAPSNRWRWICACMICRCG